MPDEALISQIENILAEVIELGGANERSQIVPNLTIQDANPSGLTGFIIVSDDRDGDNILAKKVPSVTYTNNDLVNVLFPRGGEAVAFQQGSQSASGDLWEIVPSTSTDIFYDKGKVGIGTNTIPHGGVGWATLAIDGGDFAADGANIQLTTSADDYPTMQIFGGGTHDEVGIFFDSYYDGTNRSSTTDQNFQILATGGRLRFRYDSGVAAGAALSWNEGIALRTDGTVGIGTITPGAQLESVLSTGAQLRLSHTTASKFLDVTVDTNHKATFTPSSTGLINLASKVGIDTITVPHGAIGAAKFAIEGTNGSTAGPHIQATTATDDYPVFQQLNWQHDNIGLSFDAYYDSVWRSSDSGSNFQIYKITDKLRIRYDSGIAQAGAITWNEGISLDTSGNVAIGHDAANQLVHLRRDQNSETSFKVENQTNGTGAVAGLRLASDGGEAVFGMTSQAYTAISGWGDSFFIDSNAVVSGGIKLAANAGNIQFYIGGRASGNIKLLLNSTGASIGHSGAPSTRLDIDAGAMEFAEMTAPAAGAANTTRTYAEDNAGTTRQRVKFSSGNAVTIAEDGGLQTYTITNVTTDRAYDANATTVAELADALGTLIADFQAAGILG